MKAKSDPRHQKRVQLMKNLYSFSFESNTSEDQSLIQPVTDHVEDLDNLISSCAPEWPLEQINRIDLAILRLAIYELKYQNTPYKVVIDESVELAKEYGSENSSKFVNGVLGAVLAKIGKDTK